MLRRAKTSVCVRARAAGADANWPNNVRSITGSDFRSITGSDIQLLALGRITFVGSDFISVLGQTVFVDSTAIDGLHEGLAVAVYGSLDFETGGIVDATVVDAGNAGFGASSPSFLTGFVDSVDYAKGIAVVSGMAVDYTALLGKGSAPNVGDQVAITGYEYATLGVLVADPQLQLETR